MVFNKYLHFILEENEHKNKAGHRPCDRMLRQRGAVIGELSGYSLHPDYKANDDSIACHLILGINISFLPEEIYKNYSSHLSNK